MDDSNEIQESLLKGEHEEFCRHYVEIGHAAKAYQKAYSKPTLDDCCYASGSRLLKRTDVQARIKVLRNDIIQMLHPSNFAQLLLDASLGADITQYFSDDGTITHEELQKLPDRLKRLLTEVNMTETKIGEQSSEKKYKLKTISPEFAVKQSLEIYKYMKEQESKTNSMPSGYEVGQINMNIQISNPTQNEQKNDIESSEEDD